MLQTIQNIYNAKLCKGVFLDEYEYEYEYEYELQDYKQEQTNTQESEDNSSCNMFFIQIGDKYLSASYLISRNIKNGFGCMSCHMSFIVAACLLLKFCSNHEC